MTYRTFFEAITGRPSFPYQVRLGIEPWPDLLDVPTGLGKTAAIIVAWLYKRLQKDSQTGARLVYCLPMRVLVEQTASVAEEWCRTAEPLFSSQGLPPPTVHVLMGGDVDDEWESDPTRSAILVGTQDLLLSRALNRGYALSRYKWPVHFALLNNDCLWAFDETQLIGVGIETSAQLQGFRDKLGVHRTARTVWMSATLGEQQLDTVDHPRPVSGWQTLTLSADDISENVVRTRLHAVKVFRRLESIRLDKQTEKSAYPTALVEKVLTEHAQRGGLTLVIVNRVARAQAIYKRLLKAEGRTEENTALVHSRFRGADRRREEAILRDATVDRIVVATQAVEAGVDVSARTMFTELAPWPSLVQRFGRCNRFGEDEGLIYWLDIDTETEKTVLSSPYAADELDRARELLGRLHDNGGHAGPYCLKAVDYHPAAVVRPVIRRRDLHDLFDTTPDLSGHDLDISRYVRDGDDTDVQVYWRDFKEGEPPDSLKEASRDELCRVSIAAANSYLKELAKQQRKLAGRSERDKLLARRLRAWRWNPLEGEWQVAPRAFPGQILLLHADAGGYQPRLGWTGETGTKNPVPPVDVLRGPLADREGYDGDRETVLPRLKQWVALSDHLAHVQGEAVALAHAAEMSEFSEALGIAGLWHDVGKAHETFQERLLTPLADRPELAPVGAGPWAKSNHDLRTTGHRKHFRHELASALAWLATSSNGDFKCHDLIAYLIAAHHGKVRMSLRSLPGETEPKEAGRLFARGVWDGDELSFELPDGRRFDNVKLDLSLMQLGKGSWVERMLALRDAEHLGPFRLTLLETCVRIADWRASQKEREGVYDA